MKDAKKTTIDPELERNTGPNLAEHPLWSLLKQSKQRRLEKERKEERIGKGPERIKPR
jgi:hypothetical protein